MRQPLLAVAGVALFLGLPAPSTFGDEANLPVLFKDDFENGAARWAPTDPAAWKVIATDRGKVYSQFQKSKYEPPHRSPFNVALVKDVSVGDFVLEAKVQSTVKDYGHRDMCLFFG